MYLRRNFYIALFIGSEYNFGSQSMSKVWALWKASFLHFFWKLDLQVFVIALISSDASERRNIKHNEELTVIIEYDLTVKFQKIA